METLLCARWISSVLTTDSVLQAGLPGGWQELPALGTPSPWGRVESIGQAEDVRADQGGHLIWARPTFLITIFDNFENYTRIEPLARRVYLLLNGQFYPVVSGGTLFSCVRDFGNQGVENIGGIEVRRLFQQFSFYAADDVQP
jgi:hypothetical protein